MVYKADLISMAAEKDAKEAEILIDSFLNNIRLQDLCSFSIKIPIPQIKNADVLITE